MSQILPQFITLIFLIVSQSPVSDSIDFCIQFRGNFIAICKAAYNRSNSIAYPIEYLNPRPTDTMTRRKSAEYLVDCFIFNLGGNSKREWKSSWVRISLVFSQFEDIVHFIFFNCVVHLLLIEFLPKPPRPEP
ncbi:hypothetical protein L1987_78294 [Smallanthus sonchifolius]|uniref:Uncharacterized protein n=1 Tax=Smallanthus sonchifolius TaxID=185202 RepID=A0ACB8ZC95_9ASTR|nr:hypothetical protein L1987_78294 [Smallanthus sonchifolius]